MRQGVVIGLVGAVVWVKLVTPFAGTDAEPWSRVGYGLRLTAAGLVVPVFEELLIRGYVLRVALQWDRARTAQCDSAFGEAFDNRSISEVEPSAWTWWAVIISTAAFALGHTMAEWPAALAYGLLMAGLWIACKDLLSCVIAHGVTNVALALYVWTSGAWQLWP